jgi:hypothetical protein
MLLIAEASKRQLTKAIKAQQQRWKTEVNLVGLPDTLALLGDPEHAAQTQFADYLATIGGEMVPASGPADMPAKLLRRYFAAEAPFERAERKKHEFPDVFALLSLEALAKSKRKLLLCVSPDSGWKNFAAQSEHLVCAADLELTLSYFNDAGRIVADRTMDLWKRGAAPRLAAGVEHAFEYRLDDADFEADGSSPLEYESEPNSAVVQYVKPETASAPVVIAADNETVTFTTKLKAIVSFDAEFTFFVRDFVGNDYVRLGVEPYTTEDEIEFDLVITVLRNLDPEPQVVDVEVGKRRLEVDFGAVEPFPHEDPTHEKY